MQRKYRSHRVTKILVEALESRRLLSAGGLDPSFNGDGITSTNFAPLTVTGNAMAVAPNGDVVEVGSASGGDYSVAVFKPDGTLDTSFGPTLSGKFVSHVGPAGAPESGISVAVQSDGKIVVGGVEGLASNGTDGLNMFIVRLLPDGSYDDSFSGGGVVQLGGIDSTTGQDARPNALAIQKDGKILIAGEERQGLFSANDNAILVRLNTNGSLDKSFGSNGQDNIDLDENEDAEAIAIDYNGTASTNSDYGKIILAGHQAEKAHDDAPLSEPNDTYKILLARYTANGSLDKTFDFSGTLVTTAGSTAKSVDAEAVTVESGGTIVVAGSEGTRISSTDHKFFLAQFTVKGALDKNFGANGNVTTSFGANDEADSIVTGGFGQQLIVGGTSSGDLGLAAYNLDGSVDASFGNNGKTIVGFDASKIQLALGPNHTIVAGGGTDFETARFFDAGPDVSVSSIDPTAGPTTSKIIGFKGKFPIVELVPNNASMIVARDENLPIATRVYFTIGGTALPPNVANIKLKKNNYTLSGMTVETLPANSKIAYVDIPAGQTFTTVTFTPNIIPAATTTATFTINSNLDYQTSFPPSQTITLLGTNPAPAATTLNPTEDTYVQDGNSANLNFGTANPLFVKKSSTTGNQQTYLMFNLSSLSTFNSVKLTLFGALNSAAQASLVTQLFSVADTSWLESGMTWNKKRAVSASPLASATITGTTPQSYTFDVTSYVRAQLAKGIKIVSFALINPTASTSAILFNSREAPSNKPTLTVT
jgi:uncharacterized delta-60 repeat protein